MPDATVYPTPEELAEAAAERFVALAAEAVAARGRFCAVLSGGSTPRATYARLAEPDVAARVAWPRVYLFWGDERCVPPGDPESNYRLAWEAWLRHVPIPEGNVTHIRGELAPAEAAAEYEARLRSFFRGQTLPGSDLALLGMGDDGHTASLFPGSPALHEEGLWVAAVIAPKPPAQRVTLTPPALNATAHVVFLVSGASKAEVLRRVRHGPHQPEALPAQAIAPTHGDVTWLVDADAAGEPP